MNVYFTFSFFSLPSSSSSCQHWHVLPPPRVFSSLQSLLALHLLLLGVRPLTPANGQRFDPSAVARTNLPSLSFFETRPKQLPVSCPHCAVEYDFHANCSLRLP